MRPRLRNWARENGEKALPQRHCGFRQEAVVAALIDQVVKAYVRQMVFIRIAAPDKIADIAVNRFQCAALGFRHLFRRQSAARRFQLRQRLEQFGQADGMGVTKHLYERAERSDRSRKAASKPPGQGA